MSPQGFSGIFKTWLVFHFSMTVQALLPTSSPHPPSHSPPRIHLHPPKNTPRLNHLLRHTRSPFWRRFDAQWKVWVTSWRGGSNQARLFEGMFFFFFCRTIQAPPFMHNVTRSRSLSLSQSVSDSQQHTHTHTHCGGGSAGRCAEQSRAERSGIKLHCVSSTQNRSEERKEEKKGEKQKQGGSASDHSSTLSSNFTGACADLSGLGQPGT